MKRNRLNEDKLPPQLLVKFSSKISKEIDVIGEYNHNNTEGLSQWRSYLNWIKHYLSNPAIAWDYTNRYRQYPNGARFIGDFDINVGYSIINNNTTHQLFVFVFMVNLKPQEFGLKIPSDLKEDNQQKRKIRLTESDLHKIIKETIYEALCKIKNPVV